MINQEEIVKRLIHLQDLKITLLTMEINRKSTENLFSQQIHISDGFNYELYSKLKSQDKEIEEQIKIIDSDQKDLLEKVKI